MPTDKETSVMFQIIRSINILFNFN